MPSLFYFVVACALLGAVVGFLAGLLGIGGGLIIVPVLSILLGYYGIVSADQLMIVAIATSLASIIFTATSSAIAHHRQRNVPWRIAPWIMFGVGIGALLSSMFASNIQQSSLEFIFAFSVSLIAIRMVMSSANDTVSRSLPGGAQLGFISTFIGSLSSLIGIGGGALLVPVLNYFSVDMRKAIGCASASGIVIALLGTSGYIIAGVEEYDLFQGFLGYVYLPALLGIVVTSALFAPLGAKAVQYLPIPIIKKVFASLLLIIAGKMLFT